MHAFMHLFCMLHSCSCRICCYCLSVRWPNVSTLDPAVAIDVSTTSTLHWWPVSATCDAHTGPAPAGVLQTSCMHACSPSSCSDFRPIISSTVKELYILVLATMHIYSFHQRKDPHTGQIKALLFFVVCDLRY